MKNTTIIGDVATPIFATLGLTSTTSEIMEYIFLSLTIISLLISIGSRLYTGYQRLKKQHTEASKDGVITTEEVTEIIESAVDTAVGVGSDVEKIKEVIDGQKDTGKD